MIYDPRVSPKQWYIGSGIFCGIAISQLLRYLEPRAYMYWPYSISALIWFAFFFVPGFVMMRWGDAAAKKGLEPRE